MKLSFVAIFAATWMFGAMATSAIAAPQAIAGGMSDAARISAGVGGPNILTAGPIAPATLACDVKPASVQNSVASIDLGPIVTTSETANDTVASMYDSTSAAVQSVSTVQGLSVLGGAITATALEAVANSTASGKTASSNGKGSTFVDLVVNGHAIGGTPEPNTRIEIPGIGVVTLNEQTVRQGPGVASSIDVEMIDVRVTTANSFGLPVGAEVVVAHAASNIAVPPVPVAVDASSYALYAFGSVPGSFVQSGPWAPAQIPCSGGTAQDSLARLTLAYAALGTMVDSAAGSAEPGVSTAAAQSQIQDVNLLAGLITASAITSDASVELKGHFSRIGSVSIVSGSIAGARISASPAPNTVIKLAGLGYVILNEEKATFDAGSVHLIVNAIHVVVTTRNVLGLPVGASIIVAHSSASLDHF
jgi:hypothetical protein